MNFEELQDKVLSWASDRDLLHPENADKQFLKFVEEVYEFKTEMDLDNFELSIPVKPMQRIKYSPDRTKEMKLEMGDIFVTLIILCEQLDIDLVECLSMTYEKIKDRSGKTIKGTFIKREDLNNAKEKSPSADQSI